MITVPRVGTDERAPPQFVSRATLTRIVKPRVEEILEMVRDRLAASPFAAEPRARVILTGGGGPLHRVSALATRLLSPPGPVRPPPRPRGASCAGPTAAPPGAAWPPRSSPAGPTRI